VIAADASSPGRIAVVADVHANLTAFDAVGADWGQIDDLWCLGDVVGYGPDPNECVARRRVLKHVCIAGNHDYAALGKIDVGDFNPAARAAAEWTAGQLTPSSHAYLSALQETERKGPVHARSRLAGVPPSGNICSTPAPRRPASSSSRPRTR
jgi:hypothetical protein